MGAIIKEISLTQYLFLGEENNIATLYFGGGTPSLLTDEELGMIFTAVQRKFTFNDEVEITLEANPDDITDEKLSAWRSLGVNRLSVGVQSFLEEELKWMNRAHTATDSLVCIDKIFAAGFTNFSVDLIYGSPLLSDKDWEKNVAILIEKNIPHISCYALTVEPKTALDKMIIQKKAAPVDPEKQARQFLLLMQWMEKAGYEHYEISNFAKPGMRSRHNSSYWSQTPEGKGTSYYGFGPSAHSFDGSTRRWNIANNALYIQSLQNNIIPVEEEELTSKQQLNEYIMTSLRTMEGLDLDKITSAFGEKFSEELKVQSTKFIDSGKLLLVNDHLVLTREGKLFADGIASDLFIDP